MFVIFIFLLILKIAPYADSRYIYMLYPCFNLLLLKFYYLLFNKFIKKKISYFLVLFLVIISTCNVYSAENLKFSFAWKNSQQIERIIEERYPMINVIFIFGNDNWNQAISQFLLFSKTKETLFVEEKNIELLKGLLQSYTDKNDALFIFISRNVKNEEYVKNKIANLSSYKYFKKVDFNFGTTFLLEKIK